MYDSILVNFNQSSCLASSTAQKMKISWSHLYEVFLVTFLDHISLVTFTEEILNGKFHFLCSGSKFQDLKTKHFPSINSSLRPEKSSYSREYDFAC